MFCRSKAFFCAQLFFALPLIGVLAWVPGCKGCDRDKPYVPYTIGDATADRKDASAAAVASASSGAVLNPSNVERPPANVSDWTTAGVTLHAPAGNVFVAAVVGDFDHDGTPDAVALVEATILPKVRTLVFMPRGEGGLPGVVLSDQADCAEEARGIRLEAVGAQEFLLVLPAECPTSTTSKRAEAFYVFGLHGRELRSSVSGRLFSRAGDARLFLAAEVKDSDADGIADVLFSLSFEGRSGANLPFRYLSRATGYSRDTSEPSATFAAVTRKMRAAKGKGAPSDLANAALLRELGFAFASRILVGGRRFALPEGLVELMAEEARAHVGRGSVWTGLGLFQRWGELVRDPKKLDEGAKWVSAQLPVVDVTEETRVARVEPSAIDGASWGTLAFGDHGEVLLRADSGVHRLEPGGTQFERVPGLSPWETAVVAPAGTRRWVATVCDRTEGMFAELRHPAADVEPGELTLSFQPCVEGLTVVPILSGPDGLVVAVNGVPTTLGTDFRAAEESHSLTKSPGRLGSPRSRSGLHDVNPFVLFSDRLAGLLVTGDPPRLFRFRSLTHADYRTLRHCTVSDDGLRVACIQGREVILGQWR